MFNKKYKELGNKIVELKLSLSTSQLLYDSISNRLNREDGKNNKEVMAMRKSISKLNFLIEHRNYMSKKNFEKTDTRIEKLERVTESDTNSIVNLSNKLEEKDKMIRSLREEVSEIKEVVKEFLKVSGYQVRMVRNENYLNAHSIKVTKIDNSSKKKI